MSMPNIRETSNRSADNSSAGERILVREVISGDGGVYKERTIRCGQRGRWVPADDCAECERCEGFLVDASGTKSYVRCTYTVPDQDRDKGRSAADTTPVVSVMSKRVICVTPDVSVEQLASLLLDRQISGVPVVDPEGNPMGIVSKTDLVRERSDRGDTGEIRKPTPDGYDRVLEPGFHSAQLTEATVGEVMTPSVFTLRTATSISQAAALMAFERVHRVPVVTEQGQVVGVISSLDILRWIAAQDGYATDAPPQEGR